MAAASAVIEESMISSTLMTGTGSTNHAETIELTKFAQEIGADAAMVIVPYYNRPSQAALYKHCELPTTYASLRGGGFKRLVCVR
ncbi:Dihydrodipicolinate synthase [Geobacillus stearothermophilus]|uniref:Dihydrodipicolinate synthase n=1 Tax=Geobacillus stearothermophilus TaxID=1422 RepID=A0A150ND82_GEOSE|nr:Dihydrodipicolinate synthase [Geobacillus stearothermophilus]